MRTRIDAKIMNLCTKTKTKKKNLRRTITKKRKDKAVSFLFFLFIPTFHFYFVPLHHMKHFIISLLVLLSSAVASNSATTDTLCCQRDGRRIFGVMHRPEQGEDKMPLVIISHGFGGSNIWGIPYAEALTAQGYLVYCFDFCGGGNRSQSDGDTREMSVMTERADLLAVLHRLRELPEVDSRRITLFGESQGGIVTALAAAEAEALVHDIILFYPAFSIPYDTHQRYPTRADIPNEGEIWGMHLGRCYAEDIYDLDPYATIAPFRKPVLIIHGDSDRVVPIAFGDRAAQTYTDATFHVLHGVDHGFYGLPQRLAIQLVTDFLEKQK